MDSLQLNQKLQQAKEIVERIDSLLAKTRVLTESDSSAFDNYNKIRHAMHYAKRKLTTADLFVAGSHELDGAIDGLRFIENYIKIYVDTKNATHLALASEKLLSHLHCIFAIPDINLQDDVSEFRELVDSYHKYTSDIIKQIEAEINSIRQDRNSIFKELEDFKSNFKAHQDQLEQNLQLHSTELVNSVDKYKTDVEKIVGTISMTAMAGGYQATANEHKASAEKWEHYAKNTFYFWLAFILLRFTISSYCKVESDWPTVVQQLLLSTPFFLLVGFSALQVTQHRRAERKNRRAELELATLNPYLASLPEEAQNEIKKMLSEKLFGQLEVDSTKSDSTPWVNVVTELVKKIK